MLEASALEASALGDGLEDSALEDSALGDSVLGDSAQENSALGDEYSTERGGDDIALRPPPLLLSVFGELALIELRGVRRMIYSIFLFFAKQ